MITTLIFDFYGTLCDIKTEDDKPYVWAQLAIHLRSQGIITSAQELRNLYLNELKAQNAIAGQSYEVYPDLPIEPVFSSILHHLGIVDDKNHMLGYNLAMKYREYSRKFIRLFPDIKETLELLRLKGYHTILLSNAQASFTNFEIDYLGVRTLFDHIYLSSDYGIRKPDQRFMKLPIVEHSLFANNCMYLGNDYSTDILGGNLAGYQTVFTKTYMGLHEDDTSTSPMYTLIGDDWIRSLPELLQKINLEEKL